MSLLSRLNRIVRANLNDLATRVGGGDGMRGVGANLRDARAQLIECRVLEKRFLTDYEGLLDEAASWEERAFLALKSGDEPLAREALQRKHEIEHKAKAVKEHIDSQRSYSMDLTSALDAIDVKFDALKQHGEAEKKGSVPPYKRKGSIPPYRKLADAELGTFSTATDVDFATFDDMADRLSAAADQIEAMRELRGDEPFAASGESTLESRFRELEADRDLDNLSKRSAGLDDLRRRLNDE
jgi:phage shock protein A